MSHTQRLVLIVSILASFIAFLDGSVVNVALPAISHALGGGLGTQQWIVDAYLIMLGALILLAGSLSDLFGRKHILTLGLLGFGVASILCAISPNATVLILARGLQGIAGALLVPSSLALIISVFSGKAQATAIGRWTAWTGISFIMGPLLGGFLVDTLSWRYIFAINVLPIALCLWLLRLLEYKETTKQATLDIWGAVLCSAGLSATVFALIEQPQYGWLDIHIAPVLLVGLILLVSFVRYERRSPHPMLPLSLFRIRNFYVGNLATIAIYGGLSVATFLITIFLQQVVGYSALDAGLALIPTTCIMFLLSPRFGTLAGTYGPRLFMALGPILAGAGFLLMLRIRAHSSYWTHVLPGVLMFACGLSVTVAPLTSAVLRDIDGRHAGIASAINNAVSRVAGLIAIALAGLITGPHLAVAGFHHALMWTAALLIIGGIISAIGIRNHSPTALAR